MGKMRTFELRKCKIRIWIIYKHFRTVIFAFYHMRILRVGVSHFAHNPDLDAATMLTDSSLVTFAISNKCLLECKPRLLYFCNRAPPTSTVLYL